MSNTAADTKRRDEASRVPLRLAIYADGVLRRIHPLGNTEISIGRDADNDLVLEDTQVSRRHSRIFTQKSALWIEDRQSRNGTFVNGNTVESAQLSNGDQIEIGPFRLLVEEVPAQADNDPLTMGQDAPASVADVGPQGKVLSMLLSVLETFDASSASGAVLDRILDSVLAAMGGERAYLYRYDSRRATVACVHSRLTPGADPERPKSESLVLKVAKERQPCLLTDLLRQGGPDVPSMERLTKGLVQSIIVVPILQNRRMVGILYLDSAGARRTFSVADLDLLTRATRYLAGIVESVETREQLVEENQALLAQVNEEPGGAIPLDRLTAPASSMRGVIDLLHRAAARNVTVLLTGETGTGKEVAARTVHRLSPRADGRFLAINCGALPESLIESELFGYRKGAFSGANDDRPGLVELAHKGTLFLDEVGELPLSAQVKLLRVLEEHQVQRLGASEAQAVDFRLVAATHRDLTEKVKDGSFREDLMYRLRVFPIHIPPLRERLDDLPLIAEYLVNNLAKSMGSTVRGLEPAVVSTLQSYRWPGNVRELRNVLERALVLEDSAVLTIRSLPPEVASGRAAPAAPRPAVPSPVVPTAELRPFDEELQEFQQYYLQRLMDKAGDNIAAMSRISGLSRLTLYRKLGQIGLSRSKKAGEPAE